MWFPPGCPVNGLSLPPVVGFTQWATHGARHLKANRSGGFLGVRQSQSFISNAELTLPGFGGPRVSPLMPNSPVSDIGRLKGRKSPIHTYPTLIQCPRSRSPLSNFGMNEISPETRIMGLPYGEEIMIVGQTRITITKTARR